MEENNLTNELEQMRQQMRDFKTQLEKQAIVNEDLIVSSMRKRMSWIRKYVVFEICLVPLVILAWLGIKEYAGLSWYNYGFLVVMLIVDVTIDYRINMSALTDEDYHSCNLIATVTKLTEMKGRRRMAMQVSIPLLALWLVWSGIETWVNFPSDATDFMRGTLYGGMIGGVIGALQGLYISYRVYRKMQSTNDEMISQIHKLTDD